MSLIATYHASCVWFCRPGNIYPSGLIAVCIYNICRFNTVYVDHGDHVCSTDDNIGKTSN